MPALLTLKKMMAHAGIGTRWHDKKLAFLLAGFGVIGHHRKRLRDFYFRSIDHSTSNGVLCLKLRINSQPTIFEMRKGNEGDYLIAGELVRGSYPVPPFTPQSIVDAGANIGLFSIHASRYFPKARLTCYEPDPSNFVQLKKNLSLNRIEAQLEPVGVWSKNCTLYYHAQSSETGYVDEHPPGRPIACQLPAIGPECWLKLDVEGAEHEVLPALFAHNDYPRWISMEIHGFNIRGAALLSLLRHHGYRVDGGEDTTLDCTVISAERRATPLD
jgi:FkbM family methyltransferase